jgi:hypothetical protein
MLKRKKRYGYGLLGAALVLLTAMLTLGGCASFAEDSLMEQNWGRSWETQLYTQTANPEAGKDGAPVLVMDGASAEAAMEAYRQSFGAGKEEETVNIVKLR